MARPKKVVEWPPKKLPRDFPLTVHRRGYVKRGIGWIAGMVSPAEAMEIYHRKEQARLEALRTGVPVVVLKHAGDDQTVDELAERWLGDKLTEKESELISPDHFVKCGNAIAKFVAHVIPPSTPNIGGRRVGDETIRQIKPDHFASFGRACVAAGGEKHAQRLARLVMAMFNQAAEEDWIDRPVKFGKRYRKMASAQIGLIRKNPPTAEQVRTVIRHLDGKLGHLGKGFARDLMPVRTLKACVLLGINGGYGATDLAKMPLDVVDLDNAIIDYRRGKTKRERVVALMPETVEALRPIVEHARKKRRENVFQTREGNDLVWKIEHADDAGNVKSVSIIDSLNNAYSKVLRELKIKVAGSGFYKIKDLHIATADAFGDDRAARLLTGHAQQDRSRDGRASYGVVSDERLRKLVEYIRQEILAPGAAGLISETPPKSPVTSSAAAVPRSPRKVPSRLAHAGRSRFGGSSRRSRSA